LTQLCLSWIFFSLLPNLYLPLSFLNFLASYCPHSFINHLLSITIPLYPKSLHLHPRGFLKYFLIVFIAKMQFKLHTQVPPPPNLQYSTPFFPGSLRCTPRISLPGGKSQKCENYSH
jgi:hypothetical protein